MDTELVSSKLLGHYDTIRRAENEQITGLLDVLERVDSLPDPQMEQVRDALFHTNHPFLMVMVGPFSSGKSSIINALLGERVMEVGPIPTTDHITILRHGPDIQRTRTGEGETVFHPSPLLRNLSLVDTPGLESVFRTHEELTRRFLHRADLVMLVMLATQVLTARNLEYLQELKGYGKRVIIVVNQVDVLEPESVEVVVATVRETGGWVTEVVAGEPHPTRPTPAASRIASPTTKNPSPRPLSMRPLCQSCRIAHTPCRTGW